MDIQELIIAIASPLAAGLFSFIIGRRTSKRDDFSLIYEKIDGDNDRLREEIEKLKDKFEKEKEDSETKRKALSDEIDTLKSELNKEKAKYNDLQNKLVLLESAHHDLPIPQWIKNEKGVMLSMNDAYEEAFLIPLGKYKSDYLGKTDVEFWGKEIGSEYQRNDRRVKTQKRAISFVEPIKIGEDDMTEDWRVMKYPRWSGRTFIGIGGMAFPVNIEKGQGF